MAKCVMLFVATLASLDCEVNAENPEYYIFGIILPMPVRGGQLIYMTATEMTIDENSVNTMVS